MDSKKLREKFLKFFAKNGHKIVPSSSLLPADTSVLLTTAGMQQFKPYYVGEESPYGKNTASCQKCFRTSDIEEVGDERHLTFFEMLGNFSFGGYFKEEAIKLAKEFIDSLNIKIDYVTVFEGDENTTRDEESAEIWKKLGFSEEKGNLKFCNKEENFWGPTGEEGPCGPTTEIYAGGIEIWNIVFNEYYFKNNKLEKLETPGIDTGMGLERLAVVVQKKETVFETDLFEPIIEKLEKISGKKYRDNKKEFRVIIDHIRGACFLIADGILPGKEERNYIPRRILRNTSEVFARITDSKNKSFNAIVEAIIKKYGEVYPELIKAKGKIIEIIEEERSRYAYLIGKETEKKVTKYSDLISDEDERKKLNLKLGIPENVSISSTAGAVTGYVESTYGYPRDKFKKLLISKEIKFSDKEFLDSLKDFMDKHRKVSRKGAEQKFKGGLADHSEQTTKYHTATHLLLAALRKVLGDHVFQKGSNITAERLRFDFSHKDKLTKEEIEKVEELVNEKIKEDLEVKQEEMFLEEAKKQGAMGVFGEKYGAKVKVYSINNFSKEICGGPHVKRTSELGHFKIIKEESSSSGVRRIKALLE